MTVKELIIKLQQINNQEMKVVVNGYEGGFDDIREIKVITAYEKIEHAWWEGKYEQSFSGQSGNPMLLLPR